MEYSDWKLNTGVAPEGDRQVKLLFQSGAKGHGPSSTYWWGKDGEDYSIVAYQEEVEPKFKVGDVVAYQGEYSGDVAKMVVTKVEDGWVYGHFFYKDGRVSLDSSTPPRCLKPLK